MGFWDFLKRPVGVDYFTPRVTHLGADELSYMALGHLSPSELWASQPHLRTVVSFLARNIAQLGLHSFERTGEDRRRDRTSPLAAAMRRPNPDQTGYDLIYGLVGDYALYDRAYWLIGEDETGATLRRLPPGWVEANARDVFGAKSYTVTGPTGDPVTVPAEDVLAFTGYHPTNPRRGSPTIEALKETLAEQIEAAKYRNQVWKRGGRVSAVIERPAGSPNWSQEQRDRFREDWRSKFAGRGPDAGGTPILEDGMKLARVDFSAAEQQFVEAAKLSFSTVAAAFHVNPTMVGILDNANYSNVREFRRMLYGDTLGPLLAQIEGRVNAFLLPRLGMDPERYYAEFNIAEKLQGSFEEQAAVMSTLVGRPIMTGDEGRARFNLPAMGGDAAQLVTPLNVLIGGQASPRDSGTQNEASARLPGRKSLALKAGPTDAHRAKVSQVLTAFFRRQGKAVLSRIGAGGDWWDADRWDTELSSDLLKTSHTIAALIGSAEATRLGYDDGYDPDRTVEFLKAAAERRARNVNITTKDQLDADDADPAEVFRQAETSRAEGIAAGLATFIAGFGVTEAARQIAYDHGAEPMKTWDTGNNPRSSHAAMNGETVPIDEPFSNGQMWPGDSADADESAGCNCDVTISVP